MFQEEIARLTGKLVFQVDNRPLATFEKKLGGVLTMLRELSTLANKKFTVKVALDSRSLRGQIEKATKTKISLTNVDISHEALALQGKKIQEYLDKTPIRLTNVKIDVSKLVEQKRFVKTLMGQMDLNLPIKLGMVGMETELRRDLKLISDRNPLKLKIELDNNHLAMKLRRALIEAQKRMGALRIRIHDPQVRLKVDKQHLINEIKAAIASSEFRIRIGARRDPGERGAGGGSRGHGGRGQMERGLSAGMGFARGALPGLGAAFAFSQMNDINQKVQAANNSLEAVSGNEEKFKSNKNFLGNLTHEMGLNFRDVAPQFSSIYQSAAPKIGVGATQDMFRGIMQYGTVHGLDKEAMKGSMVALSQMFGKDKIQSEEARQQFSERMPNGMAMLAQAAFNAKQTKSNSVADFGDLMKKGNADPAKILPELGRLMKEASERNDAYRKSLETTRVAQGRMNTAFEDTVVIFAKGGFDKGMGGFFNTIAENLRKAEPLVKALGGAFEILIKPVNAFITLLGDLGKVWPKLAREIGISSKALATLATGIGLFMLPFGPFIAMWGAAVLVIEDFVSYFQGGESVFGNLVEETPGAQEAVDSIADSFQGIIDILGKVMDKLPSVTEAFGSIKLNEVFLKALQTVDQQLQNILNTMKLIQDLYNGDGKAAVQSADGINLTGGTTTWQRARKAGLIGDGSSSGGSSWFGGLSDGMSNIGNWLSTPASQRPTIAQLMMSNNSTMPTTGTTYTGQVDRSGSTPAPNITIPSITLSVTAPEGVTDPKGFATEMAPHIQELTYKAIQNAFGEVRAQQAERR